MKMKTLHIIIIFIILFNIISMKNVKKFSISKKVKASYSNNTYDDKFYPYTFDLDLITGGNFVLDTSSFYTFKKYNTLIITDDPKITIKNRYNEYVEGSIKEDGTFIYISPDKETDNYGIVGIPINIPQRILKEITISDNNIYSYLDLIKDEIDEKYINYIQDSVNTGYVLFGEKDQVFNKTINKRDIKQCSCVHPPDDDIQNEFLNYWNCKIISFSVDNIKNSAFYSINGDIYAIFGLAEEYIIAPNKTGRGIIEYYKTLIYDDFGIDCKMEKNFKPNISRMVCEKFNYAELPDFTITLEGEISMNALSFDLFKRITNTNNSTMNETHISFKILLNELDTKEYWVIGDPIVKNYNFLFDYTKKNKEKIYIVANDKYDPFSIIMTCCVTSCITLIYFSFLLFARIKINIISRKNKRKNESAKNRGRNKELKEIMKNQNDFEIPEGNIPILNVVKNNGNKNDSDEEVKLDIDDEYSINNTEDVHNNSSDMSSNTNKNTKNINTISKSISNEKDFDNKIKRLNKSKKNNNMFELKDLSHLQFSDEGEIDDEDAILPPIKKFNK